jgi:hypothetical protein
MYFLPSCYAYVHVTTEALRRSAELTMHKLVRTVLSKLYVLDPVSEEKRLASDATTPAAGTFPSSSTQPEEPVSDDPPTATQPVTPTVQSHHDAFATQKLECVLSLRIPSYGPNVDRYLRWPTIDC